MAPPFPSALLRLKTGPDLLRVTMHVSFGAPATTRRHPAPHLPGEGDRAVMHRLVHDAQGTTITRRFLSRAVAESHHQESVRIT